MSDDDDAELAKLRAQRAERLGGGAGLGGLRAQQQREHEASAAAAQFYEDSGSLRSGGHNDVRTNAPKPVTAPTPDVDVDSDDEDGPVVVGYVEEEVLMHEELRSQLPLSFGEQEVKKIRPDQIHSKFKRDGVEAPSPSVGPPRPPGVGPPSRPQKAETSGAGGSFGPPRPPSVGPPRPPKRPVGGEEVAEVGPQEGGEEESLEVGPERPPAGEDDDGDDDGDDGYGGYDGGSYGGGSNVEDPWLLPVSHEVSLVGQGGDNQPRAVTAIDIDHSGSRVLSGGLDYMVRIYDFNGMKSDMRPFREFEPHEGHPVHALSWSPTGENFLVVTGSSKAKIYDRDGKELGEFIRGDMYIRDMKNTKGHVSGLCGGQWHPSDRYTVMTCSEDGSVRIWDSNNVIQKTVIKPTLAKPVRTSVSACRYSSDGKLIAAGLNDGSIQIWSVSGKFGASAAVGQVLPPSQQMVEKQGWTYVSRPSQIARQAHRPGEEITGLTFSRDGVTLLSRGMDSTLKIWDVRKFSQPVRVISDLPCAYSTTMAIFSPDEQLVVTGVCTGDSKDETGATGAVAIFDKSNGELVRKMGMAGNVTALAWHPRLNQIFAGAGHRKLGVTRVLYDPSFSEKGVLLAATRVRRNPNPFDFELPMIIKEYDPDRKKRRRDQQEVDPSKARRPDPGNLVGIGRQAGKAKLGSGSKTLLTQHILRTKGKLNSVDETEDPREALLKHADKVDVFTSFTNAYKETQPKPIFAEEEKDEDEDE